MNAATGKGPGNWIPYFLAGLQAGMMGAWGMLLWMGFSAMWMGRSFWSAENIMATVLKGDAAIRPGFGSGTPVGIALYLAIYSLLGAGFAVAVRRRLTGLGGVLVGILGALGWYYLFFRVLALQAMPLVWLLHTERPTQFGHVVFGVMAARFPAYLPRAQAPVEVPGQAPPERLAPPGEPGAVDSGTP